MMSDWTVSSLKEHYDSKFNDLKDQIKTALEAAAVATTKAETAHEKRLDSVNEFRQTLSDQQATLARKEEVRLMIAAIEKQVDTLKDGVNEKVAAIAKCQAAAGGIRVGWGIAIGFVGLVVAIVVLITAL